MAKKRKRTMSAHSSSVDDDDEEGEWEEDTAEQQDPPVDPPTTPGTPKLMVTWNGEGSKDWYGITFEPGVAQSVEHSPWWKSMQQAINAVKGSQWSYQYVIEHPEEPK